MLGDTPKVHPLSVVDACGDFGLLPICLNPDVNGPCVSFTGLDFNNSETLLQLAVVKEPLGANGTALSEKKDCVGKKTVFHKVEPIGKGEAASQRCLQFAVEKPPKCKGYKVGSCREEANGGYQGVVGHTKRFVCSGKQRVLMDIFEGGVIPLDTTVQDWHTLARASKAGTCEQYTGPEVKDMKGDKGRFQKGSCKLAGFPSKAPGNNRVLGLVTSVWKASLKTTFLQLKDDDDDDDKKVMATEDEDGDCGMKALSVISPVRDPPFVTQLYVTFPLGTCCHKHLRFSPHGCIPFCVPQTEKMMAPATLLLNGLLVATPASPLSFKDADTEEIPSTVSPTALCVKPPYEKLKNGETLGQIGDTEIVVFESRGALTANTLVETCRLNNARPICNHPDDGVLQQCNSLGNHGRFTNSRSNIRLNNMPASMVLRNRGVCYYTQKGPRCALGFAEEGQVGNTGQLPRLVACALRPKSRVTYLLNHELHMIQMGKLALSGQNIAATCKSAGMFAPCNTAEDNNGGCEPLSTSNSVMNLARESMPNLWEALVDVCMYGGHNYRGLTPCRSGNEPIVSKVADGEYGFSAVCARPRNGGQQHLTKVTSMSGLDIYRVPVNRTDDGHSRVSVLGACTSFNMIPLCADSNVGLICFPLLMFSFTHDPIKTHVVIPLYPCLSACERDVQCGDVQWFPSSVTCPE